MISGSYKVLRHFSNIMFISVVAAFDHMFLESFPLPFI